MNECKYVCTDVKGTQKRHSEYSGNHGGGLVGEGVRVQDSEICVLNISCFYI